MGTQTSWYCQVPEIVTMSAKPSDKQAQRREAVLQAAGKVFFDKGFDRATTLEIATAAGVSKRDLYALFQSKELILEALISGSVTRMAAPVDLAAPKNRAHTLATLEAFGIQFLTFLLGPEPMSLYRLAIALADRNPATGRALLKAGIEGTTERFAAFVHRASDAGYLQISADDRADAIASYLSVVIGGLQMCQLLDPTTQATADDIAGNVRRAMKVLLSWERKTTSAK